MVFQPQIPKMPRAFLVTKQAIFQLRSPMTAPQWPNPLMLQGQLATPHQLCSLVKLQDYLAVVQRLSPATPQGFSVMTQGPLNPLMHQVFSAEMLQQCSRVTPQTFSGTPLQSRTQATHQASLATLPQPLSHQTHQACLVLRVLLLATLQGCLVTSQLRSPVTLQGCLMREALQWWLLQRQ
jgi:hypothetical protein